MFLLVGLAFLLLVSLVIVLFKAQHKLNIVRSQVEVLNTEIKHRSELIEELKIACDAYEDASASKDQTIHSLEMQLSNTKIEMQQKSQAFEDKLYNLQQAHKQFEETFKALSFEALQKNNHSFLTLAKETMEKFQQKAEGDLEKKSQAINSLFTPMKATLDKLEDGMHKIEQGRKGDHESLKEQIKHMLETEKSLKEETATLVKALRSPITRGQWGELQLKRVVEMAGMIAYCDFIEQKQDNSDLGRLRPDMVIKLPSNKQVIVDAKTPFEAYFEAMQTPDDAIKDAKLKLHAKHVRQHVMQLGKKSYWETFKPSPEFVVLFLPSETFFSAALEHDPSLIEAGVEQGVILATPITLIGLLKAIAYGWKQETLSQHAKEIASIGEELYKRVLLMHGHFTKLGGCIEKSVEEYNKTVASMESRVLSSARKFQKFGIGLGEEEELKGEMIEKIPKTLALSREESVSTPLISEVAE